MQRFFVEFPLVDMFDIIDDDMVHQIGRVLRARIGDMIILFCGDGTESRYEILSISKKSISLKRMEVIVRDISPSQKITLMQALPNKYEKIEYIIQKGVEIGIDEFVFFRSDRSQGLSISPSKQDRFLAIAREATEQCGGLSLPSIRFTEKGLESLIQTPMINLMLDTQGDRSLDSSLRTASHVHLWVGPEGGWSEDERSKMNINGFISVHLGNRVFRTETASIVIGSLLIYAL